MTGAMHHWDSREINKNLKKLYEDWYEIIKDKFYYNDNPFSNPYYLGVPDNWNERTETRILFIGKEGYSGHWNKHDMNGNEKDGVKDYFAPNDIEELQQANAQTIEYCIFGNEEAVVNSEGKNGEPFSHKFAEHTQEHNNQFWRTIRRIASFDGKEKPVDSVSCAWTNTDLICYNKDSNNRCNLYAKDLQNLHSTKILSSVIKCAKPTHIVFFSWRDKSIVYELGEELPLSDLDTLFEKEGNQAIFEKEIEGIPCYISYYHPSARIARDIRDEIVNGVHKKVFSKGQ